MSKHEGEKVLLNKLYFLFVAYLPGLSVFYELLGWFDASKEEPALTKLEILCICFNPKASKASIGVVETNLVANSL